MLEGYRIAIDYIDEVINIIRSSKSIADAKANLSERFGLSDVQATAIVQMQLGRLSGLERDKIEEDYNQTSAKIAEYEDILANEARVLEIIKTDLIRIKDKYGDERRTEISMIADDIDDEDLIDEEEVIITLTHNGYSKRLPVDTYKSQHRGGRGITGMSTREEDYVEHIFTCSTHDNILFFTTRGVVYSMKGYRIPESSRQARGTAIVNILPLESGEKVTAMMPIHEFEENKSLVFVTKNGVVKKSDLMSYKNIRKSGLRAINLDDDDDLIKVALTDGEAEIMLTTYNGMAIRFNEADVREVGRVARGVKGITLREGDSVVGAVITEKDSEDEVLIVSENGYGKRTSLTEFRGQKRAGVGLKAYKITEKTGNIAGVVRVDETDDVLLITSGGVVIRMDAAEISTIGRNTQGVRLMKLDDGVKVVSVSLTDKTEEEEKPESEAEAENTENIEVTEQENMEENTDE